MARSAALLRFLRPHHKKLEYWKQLGFSGFREGLFWITNPDDCEDVLDAWLHDTSILDENALHVIARSGFGDLYLWGEWSGFRYVLKPARGVGEVSNEAEDGFNQPLRGG